MFNIYILSLPLCLISQFKLYFQTHMFYQAYLPLDSYLFRECTCTLLHCPQLLVAYFTLIHQYLVDLQHYLQYLLYMYILYFNILYTPLSL